MSKKYSCRIVHVTECLASGTLNFLMQATSELAKMGASQVLLYSRRPDTPEQVRELFDPSVELIEIRPLGEAYLAYFSVLRRQLRLLITCEVTVHFHSSKAGFLGRLALIRMPRPVRVLYSPHGLAFLNRQYVLPSLVFRALEWIAARAVPSIPVGCSQGEAELLSLISPTPAEVLENAVDDEFFDIDPDPSLPRTVVTIGRICYQKAPERFADLALKCRASNVPARFVWIGGGESADEQRLRSAGIEVTGWVSRQQVKQGLSEAYIYVQTSRWEGMPLSVLQALAAGVPCVVTDVVGNRDAVRDGLSGYVSADGDVMFDALCSLLTDDRLRDRYAGAARRDARERFASGSFQARLRRLYRFDDGAPASGLTGTQSGTVF